MQLKEAQDLNRRWIAAGNKKCEHPRLVKEHDLGAGTGDYVCTTCGESGYGRDWAKPGAAGS